MLLVGNIHVRIDMRAFSRNIVQELCKIGRTHTKFLLRAKMKLIIAAFDNENIDFELISFTPNYLTEKNV